MMADVKTALPTSSSNNATDPLLVGIEFGTDIVNYNLISYYYFATLDQGYLKRYSCFSLLYHPRGGFPSCIFLPPSHDQYLETMSAKGVQIHATKMMARYNVLANPMVLADLGFLKTGLDAPELCHSQIPPHIGEEGSHLFKKKRTPS